MLNTAPVVHSTVCLQPTPKQTGSGVQDLFHAPVPRVSGSRVFFSVFPDGGTLAFSMVSHGRTMTDRLGLARVKSVLALTLGRTAQACAEPCAAPSQGSSSGVEFLHGHYGRPELWIGDRRTISISFAHISGETWAAVCEPSLCCGIDVAIAREFEEGYPFERAFRDTEFFAVLGRTGTQRSDAAALLWSAKEAFVKALGCGFHLVDPLHVKLDVVHLTGSAGEFSAVLDGAAARKLPLEYVPSVSVHAQRFGERWVSGALLGREYCFQ